MDFVGAAPCAPPPPGTWEMKSSKLPSPPGFDDFVVPDAPDVFDRPSTFMGKYLSPHYTPFGPLILRGNFCRLRATGDFLPQKNVKMLVRLTHMPTNPFLLLDIF